MELPPSSSRITPTIQTLHTPPTVLVVVVINGPNNGAAALCYNKYWSIIGWPRVLEREADVENVARSQNKVLQLDHNEATQDSSMPTQPAPHIGDGWSLQVIPRGKQKDTYYFSPSGDRLRSMPEVRRYLERGPVNSVESSKKRKLDASANVSTASDEGQGQGKSSLEFGSERPLKKLPAHRLITGYEAKKETAETDGIRRREEMLIERLENRRILLQNAKAGRLAAERNLNRKLAEGYAWGSASLPTLDTKVRLEREKTVFHDEMLAVAELDAPPRLCKSARGSLRETDSEEDFEFTEQDEDYSQTDDDEDSVASEGLEGFEALASAAAGEEPLTDSPRTMSARQPAGCRWEERFNELVEFKKVHGHCNVKQRSRVSRENGTLCNFVKKMRSLKKRYDRQQYSGSVLTPSRIERLDRLGFVWDRRDGQQIKSFDDRMQELAVFKAEHGHADIPRSLEDNMSLARWACVVRQSYRQQQQGGKPALTLTKEMIERLEAIGFRLRVKEMGKTKRVPFEERLKSLAEFKKIRGHVNVSIAEDSNLARFCDQMRVARRKPQPGVTMKLTQDRISALDALGFEWEPRKNKRRRSRRDNTAVQYEGEVSSVDRPVLVPGGFQPASVSSKCAPAALANRMPTTNNSLSFSVTGSRSANPSGSAVGVDHRIHLSSQIKHPRMLGIECTADGSVAA